ncbi:unnamed protein product [Rotaria sp. Silwood2]|nr:unnamed protein product [Rotaria sp. Silwood2]CAF4346294.1 unnamed protein product [Rotaria sp. Silwood2]
MIWINNKILRLNYGENNANRNDLSKPHYGKLMIMADQDQDASHIKDLVVNLIQYKWSNLLKHDYIEVFITPILKITKDNYVIPFYSIPEFEQWQASTPNWQKIEMQIPHSISTAEEPKEYFSNIDRHRIIYKYDPIKDDLAIRLVFNSALSDDQLVLFSKTSTEHAISSIMDGLKPGQCKIMFICFTKNLIRDIKVARLAGKVAESSTYHHGEQSLINTIVDLAQNFVSLNNINFLVPAGQFGTCLHGGNDAASTHNDCSNNVINVVYVKLDKIFINITDLPFDTWTPYYKETVLEIMFHLKRNDITPTILDYKEYHIDTTVRFVVKL